MAVEVNPQVTPASNVKNTKRVQVWRGGPKGGDFVRYEVPLTEGMVVLDAVLWIQANLQPDLSVRWNCKAAKCGSCAAEVNGFPRLMCKSRLADYPGDVQVAPMKSFPLISDLVTDVSWNYEVNRQIPPFTPSAVDASDPDPWVIQQQDLGRVIDARRCIECFLCQDVCHVLRHHQGMDRYYGPRFMVRIASLEMHPKDALDRRELLRNQGGLGMCNVTKCCQEVCPEHIHITDDAIIPLKERVADRYFDPLRALITRVGGTEDA
jgi:succinate dehydrogenase / fumarate reductase iron-sulfur subunit